MLDQLTMLADMSPRPHTMSPSHSFLQDAVLSIVPPREMIHMELSKWNVVIFTACFEYIATCTFKVINMKGYRVSFPAVIGIMRHMNMLRKEISL